MDNERRTSCIGVRLGCEVLLQVRASCSMSVSGVDSRLNRALWMDGRKEREILLVEIF